jgi:hypothetical protein
MTDPKIELNQAGGQIQGIAGAGTVIIENFAIYNRAVEEPAAAVDAAPIALSPYPGLAYFGPGDADFFFGRDAAIERLVEAVGRQSLTALIGASGSGKSSVVLAGLAPRLHGLADAWRFTHFRIGTELERSPFLALARALAPLYVASDSDTERLKNTKLLAASLAAGELSLRDVFADCRNLNRGRRILLIADQFEEAFTLVQDEAIRNRFIDVLLAGFTDPASGGRPDICLIMTLRADFYGRAVLYRPLADALQGHVENLGPMNRAELETAIVRPAAKAKVSFEAGLVETLLDDVESKPGSLPLLQFALREMWGLQEKQKITRRAYDEIGGVEGALAKRAESIFAALTEGGTKPEMERNFQRLFTRLVTLGEGQEDTRRVVERRELGDELWSLAQRLAGEDNRLVVTNAPAFSRETAEVVHEALIRHWPRLVDWIGRDRAFQSWLRQIKSNEELWSANPGDESPLLRGSMLAQAEDWLAKRRDDLSKTELDFVQASLAAAELQKQKVRRATLLTRIGLVVVSALAVAAVGGAFFGFQKASEAKRETLRAEQRSAVLAANVARSFTEEGAPDQSLLLMLDAARVFDDTSVPDEVRIAFTKALQEKQQIDTKILFPQMEVFETDDALVLVDPATQDIWKLTDSIEPMRLVAGSPKDVAILKLRQTLDGKDYIVVRENLDIERIDSHSGARRKLGSLPEPTGGPWGQDNEPLLDITDDGLVVRKFSASGASNAYIQIFDSQTGHLMTGEEPNVIYFSRFVRKNAADGLYAISSSNDRSPGQVYEIKSAQNGFNIAKATLSPQDVLTIRFSKCKQIPIPVQKSILIQLKDAGPMSEVNCSKFANNYLLSRTEPGTSIGEVRTDTIFGPNGESLDVHEVLSKALSEGISSNNVAWVGGYPKTESQLAPLKKEWLAVLLNRSAYVIEHDREGNSASDSSGEWSLILDYRHPTPVKYARFAGPDKLIVVESDTGRLVMHKLGNKPTLSPVESQSDDIIGSEKPIKTLHHGNCVGNSIPLADSLTMSDGRAITLNAGADGSLQIHVSGAKETTMKLSTDISCVEFSDNWRRMLTVSNMGIKIFDFDSILKTSSVKGSETGEINLKNAVSAAFVGATGESVVASDWNRVSLWKPATGQLSWKGTAIYTGDNPIRYVEPDATGERVILLEDTGIGEVHGFLYSIPARQAWLDLGTEYKWLGATFTDKSAIAVAHSNHWTDVFPILPLSALAALADKVLSMDCRPLAPKEYRQSKCWPAAYNTGSD